MKHEYWDAIPASQYYYTYSDDSTVLLRASEGLSRPKADNPEPLKADTRLIEEVFQIMDGCDLNGHDGVINMNGAYLEGMLEELSPEAGIRIKTILSTMDLSQDGQISYDQWRCCCPRRG